MKYKFLTLLFLISSWTLSGQSLQGPTGFLNTPSAFMEKAGTFYMGVHQMDEINFPGKKYPPTYQERRWLKGDFQNVFFDITLFSFLEINFRNNIKDMVNDDGKKLKQADRDFSVKLQVLKETAYLPAVALGGNDVYGNAFDKYYYIATGKHFNISKELLQLSLGYAYSPKKRGNPKPESFFAGIAYIPSFCKDLRMMADYDSKNINIGASYLLLKHFYAIAVLQDFNYISGGISYKIYLKK